MVQCSNCRQENPEGAKFCLACGQQLAAAAPVGRDERRIVSVVFVDLVGFTSRSEQLDPEDVRAFLTPYHDFVRREFESFGGVVEKFIGDAIVAVFDAPTAYGDDAERAVRAALAVRDGVRELGELDVLRGIWERVAAESVPYLVTVLGPAGIGKTRLAQEFDGIVEELGGRTVHGRSLPYRESSAYFAFATQVKQLCGIFESDPPEVGLRKLGERVLDESVTRHLAILLGLDPEGSVDDREELSFSVRVFIESVAREQPTMLVLEDIHWADRSLLDLVELLAARLRDLPVLILTLARPELLDLRPAWGGGLPAYTALPLSPLSTAEAEELAQLRLGQLHEAATKLADTAGGNPLFIEQLAATMAESSAAGALPTTIRGILAARLDALPAEERALLLDAAVVGKTFWRGALERMVDGSDGLSELLGALERRDLIVRDTTSAIEGEQQFVFKHVLIRDVVYEHPLRL